MTIAEKNYYKIKEYNLNGENYFYERIDSSEAKVYRYLSGDDRVYYDFLIIETGDSAFLDREDEYGWQLLGKGEFIKWGINSSLFYFDILSNNSIYHHYSFMKDVGLYQEINGDVETLLNGFIKDGVVYGDTSLIADNSGEDSWSILNLGTTDNLTDIYFLNDQMGWILGSSGTLIKTSDGGEHWDIDTIPYQGLKKIQFISEETGWIIGNDSLVLKTTDGGISWLEQKVNLGSLGDIHFFNDQVGLICGGQEGEYGKILRTTDGGKIWQKNTLSDYSPVLTKFCFIDSLNGWTTGVAFLFKTSDAGITWEKISNGTSDEVFDIYFADPMNGITCGWFNNGTGHNGGEIHKTTNGGYSWKKVLEDYSTVYLSIASNKHSNSLYSVGGAILKSVDNGDTWFNINNPSSMSVGSIIFTDERGWIIGKSGTILTKSTTTDVKEKPEPFASYFSLYQNYPNPFNPSTKIKFVIPKSSFVSLKVYDILGREVATLLNEEKHPGSYEVEFDGSNLSSGIYFYRLQARDFSDTKKFILLK